MKIIYFFIFYKGIYTRKKFNNFIWNIFFSPFIYIKNNILVRNVVKMKKITELKKILFSSDESNTSNWSFFLLKLQYEIEHSVNP